MGDTQTADKKRFVTLIAILLTLVAIVSALILAYTIRITGQATGADRTGLMATLRAEQTRIASQTALYEHYRAYTDYVTSQELADRLGDALNTATSDQPGLAQQRAEAVDRMSISQAFFPRRYLNQDGSYNSQRDLGEAWAQAEQSQDLDPRPHFERADRLRVKANRLRGIMILFAIALLALNMAKVLHPARRTPRYAAIGIGTTCLLLGAVAALFVILV